MKSVLGAPWLRCAVLLFASFCLPGCGSTQTKPKDDPAQRHIYFTNGVHNEFQCNPPSICVADRKAGDPSNPIYPQWWTSEWTMYRVFNNYEKYPPPYSNPPTGLTPAACTRISSSPSWGSGVGISAGWRTSGPPNEFMTMAFMADEGLSFSKRRDEARH